MELSCNSNQEAYDLGIVVGYLCAEQSCHVVPRVNYSNLYKNNNTELFVLLGETIDGAAICSYKQAGQEYKTVIDPLLPKTQKYTVDNFSLQDAYRIGILAGLRIVASVA